MYCRISPDDRSEFIAATQEGDLTAVRDLLNKYSADELLDESGIRPLYLASLCGQLLIAKELLEQGADPTLLTRLNDSPLHAAAAKGHLEIVRELVAKGADLHLENADKQTPLMVAEASGHHAVIQYLTEELNSKCPPRVENQEPHLKNELDSKEENTVSKEQVLVPIEETLSEKFEKALISGDRSAVEDCLKKGADSNMFFKGRLTPIYIAVASKRMWLVELLLGTHVNVNVLTDDAWSPLYMSVVLQDYECIKWLLMFGANVLEKNMRGETALHAAAKLGNLKIVRLLLNYQANRYQVDDHNNYPEDLAMSEGHPVVAHFIKKYNYEQCVKKVVVTQENGEGVMSAFVKANCELHYSKIKTLLEEYAFDSREIVPASALIGEHEQSPLSYVISEGRFDIADLYLQIITDHQGEAMFKVSKQDVEAVIVRAQYFFDLTDGLIENEGLILLLKMIYLMEFSKEDLADLFLKIAEAGLVQAVETFIKTQKVDKRTFVQDNPRVIYRVADKAFTAMREKNLARFEGLFNVACLLFRCEVDYGDCKEKMDDETELMLNSINQHLERLYRQTQSLYLLRLFYQERKQKKFIFLLQVRERLEDGLHDRREQIGKIMVKYHPSVWYTGHTMFIVELLTKYLNKVIMTANINSSPIRLSDNKHSMINNGFSRDRGEQTNDKDFDVASFDNYRTDDLFRL